MSTAEVVMAAASKIAPEAVILELSERGERKKTSAGKVVWLSSTSANQISHVFQ